MEREERHTKIDRGTETRMKKAKGEQEEEWPKGRVNESQTGGRQRDNKKEIDMRDTGKGGHHRQED